MKEKEMMLKKPEKINPKVQENKSENNTKTHYVF